MKQAEAVASSMGEFLLCLGLEPQKTVELAKFLSNYIKSQNPELYQEMEQLFLQDNMEFFKPWRSSGAASAKQRVS